MGNNLKSIDLGTGRTAIQITAGEGHVCGLLDNNDIKCWGMNSFGQLGQGHDNNIGDAPGEMGDALKPIDLGFEAEPVSVVAGGLHTCVLLNDGQIKCWGRNRHGQLGIGHIRHVGDDEGEMGENLVSVQYTIRRTVIALVAGQEHTCMLVSPGNVKCWGANQSGQLGQGHDDDYGDDLDETERNIPSVDIGDDVSAMQISAGGDQTCVIIERGGLKCWGSIDLKAVGNSTNELGNNLPTIDLGYRAPATQVFNGLSQTCALIKEVNLLCWGANGRGQLALGHTSHLFSYRQELGSKEYITLGGEWVPVSVSANGDHTCTLFENGQVKCWGSNSEGQLGQGFVTNVGDEPGEELIRRLDPIDLGTR